MKNIIVTGNTETKGFVREVREAIIFKAMGLVFQSSLRPEGPVEISRGIIESMIEQERRTVGDDKEKIIKRVFGRLKEGQIEMGS